MLNLRALESGLSDRLCGHRLVFFQFPGPAAAVIRRVLNLYYPTSSESINKLETSTVLQIFEEDEREVYARQTFEEEQLLYSLFSDSRLIVTDGAFSLAAHEKFKKTYKFVTFLDDPLQYFYYTVRFCMLKKRGTKEAGDDFEEFLFTDAAYDIGASYVRHFSGNPKSRLPIDKTAVVSAYENLGKFSLVGISDRYRDFESNLRNTIGRRAKIRFGRTVPPLHVDLTKQVGADACRRIESISGPNMELYELVKKKIW